MAKYIKQELPDFNGSGEKKVYYRMQRVQHFTSEEFIEWLSRSRPSERGHIMGVLQQVSDGLGELMAQGHTVTVKGIGTFQAAVGVKRDKELDGLDDNQPSRNAQSLEVTGVRFRVDKQLVKNTNAKCHLERGGTHRIRTQKFTCDERLQMAQEYLRKNSAMRIADYVSLTGLSRTAASLELKKFDNDPSTRIASKGRGCHKVYIYQAEE